MRCDLLQRSGSPIRPSLPPSIARGDGPAAARSGARGPATRSMDTEDILVDDDAKRRRRPADPWRWSTELPSNSYSK